MKDQESGQSMWRILPHTFSICPLCPSAAQALKETPPVKQKIHILVSTPQCPRRAPKTLIISCGKNIGRIFYSNTWSLTPGSWHRAPNSLGILWVRGASFVVIWWLLVGSWMRAAHRKDQARIEAWTFSPPPPILQRRETSWKSSEWSRLCEKASTEIPEVPVSQNFRVGELMAVPGEGCSWKGHGSPTPLPTDLAYAPLPSGSSRVSFIIPFSNKLISPQPSHEEWLKTLDVILKQI